MQLAVRRRTHFVSVATHTLVMAQTLFTLTKCVMSDYKAQPDGCSPEEFLKKQSSSKHTKMENNYATIITTALARLSEQR